VDELTRSFQAFQKRGVQLLVLSSGLASGEEFIRQVVRKEYKSMKESGLLSTKVLSGLSHTVRPLARQAELIDSVSQWMAVNRQSSGAPT
jgi:hypothetical protein